MPRYDYKCQGCGDIHEETHSIKESPAILCPACKGLCKIEITEAPAVQFVGWGWPGEDGKKSRNAKKRQETIREKDRDPGKGDMVPNVEGQVADTWMDAAHLANEKDKDPTPFVVKAAEVGEDIEKL